MATLNLPDAPSTLAWRLIVAQLQGNSDLDGVIRTWITWDGVSGCNADLASDAVASPAIRIYPTEGPMSWYSADQMYCYLNVAIECMVPGLDVEDVLNLQGAIVKALYPAPASAENAFENALVAIGAETGTIEFTQPIMEPHGTAGQGGDFHPLGSFRVKVLRTVSY